MSKKQNKTKKITQQHSDNSYRSKQKVITSVQRYLAHVRLNKKRVECVVPSGYLITGFN